MAFLALAPQSATPPKSNLVRGNAPGEWRYWGADAWSTRYSPLDQINAANFNSLQIAWQFKVGDMFGDDEYFRSTPLYANGKLIQRRRRQARRRRAQSRRRASCCGSDGLEEGIRYQKSPRPYSGRGLAYWTDGTNERVLVVTPGYHLVAIDAKTGMPDPKFGKDGVVDLMDGLGYPLVPLAVDDDGPLVHQRRISGAQSEARRDVGCRRRRPARTAPSASIPRSASSARAHRRSSSATSSSSATRRFTATTRSTCTTWAGTIRGFDIRTGKQLWKFNTIPQPGEFGAETWENGSKIGTTASARSTRGRRTRRIRISVSCTSRSAWALMDEYGGHRPGNNLFGTSVVALDVKTGQRKWHYQFVHHDIWDYDTPMAPNLLDVTINGQPRKILAQTTKQGFVYVFDRVTGQPIWPIVETPVGKSDVPGEKSSPTQPIPSKPAPFSQQGLVEVGSDRLHAGDQGRGARAREEVQDGTVLHPRIRRWTARPSSRAPGTRPARAAASTSTAAPRPIPRLDSSTSAGRAAWPRSRWRTIRVPSFRIRSRHDACGQVGVLPPPPGYTPSGGGRRGGGARAARPAAAVVRPVAVEPQRPVVALAQRGGRWWRWRARRGRRWWRRRTWRRWCRVRGCRDGASGHVAVRRRLDRQAEGIRRRHRVQPEDAATKSGGFRTADSIR